MDRRRLNTGYEKYSPGIIGKIALGITTPSVIIAFISVIIAFFGVAQAFLIAIVTFVISFVGSIVLMADIVVFNMRQKKKQPKSAEPKQMDIMRIVHMLIGIIVGIIIGYLIWGVKY